jgi:hypothetical protein
MGECASCQVVFPWQVESTIGCVAYRFMLGCSRRALELSSRDFVAMVSIEVLSVLVEEDRNILDYNELLGRKGRSKRFRLVFELTK